VPLTEMKDSGICRHTPFFSKGAVRRQFPQYTVCAERFARKGVGSLPTTRCVRRARSAVVQHGRNQVVGAITKRASVEIGGPRYRDRVAGAKRVRIGPPYATPPSRHRQTRFTIMS